MTLIELAVVLTILVALASLTLPYAVAYFSKARYATSATNSASLYSALQLYQAQYNAYPNNLNLLTDATGNLPNYIDNAWAYTGVGTQNFQALSTFSTGSLANALASLQAAGINQFAALADGKSSVNPDGSFVSTLANGATFTAEITGITTVNKLVSSAAAADADPQITLPDRGTSGGTIAYQLGYNIPAGHIVIVLGVGPANAAVGRTIASVPFYFGNFPDLQPFYTYGRFLAAFDVDATHGRPAKLIGIVYAPDISDGWESLDSSIAAYYAN